MLQKGVEAGDTPEYLAELDGIILEAAGKAGKLDAVKYLVEEIGVPVPRDFWGGGPFMFANAGNPRSWALNTFAW